MFRPCTPKGNLMRWKKIGFYPRKRQPWGLKYFPYMLRAQGPKIPRDCPGTMASFLQMPRRFIVSKLCRDASHRPKLRDIENDISEANSRHSHRRLFSGHSSGPIEETNVGPAAHHLSKFCWVYLVVGGPAIYYGCKGVKSVLENQETHCQISMPMAKLMIIEEFCRIERWKQMMMEGEEKICHTLEQMKQLLEEGDREIEQINQKLLQYNSSTDLKDPEIEQMMQRVVKMKEENRRKRKELKQKTLKYIDSRDPSLPQPSPLSKCWPLTDRSI